MALGGTSQMAMLFRIRADASQAKTEIKALGGQFDGMAKAVTTGNLAADAMAKIASGAAQAAKAIFNYSSNVQQLQVSFTSYLGSAKEAEQLTSQLATAVNDTPFNLESYSNLAQRLLAAGVASQELIPLITDVGNVVAGTGAATDERLEGVNIALSQIISKGRLSAEEMEQLAERGVPAWKILSESMGMSIAQVRKLAEEGKLGSDVMVTALRKIGREKFGDAMERQTKTASGAFNKLTNTLLEASRKAFAPQFDWITKWLNETATLVSKQGGSLSKMGNAIGAKIGEGIVDAIGDAMSDFWKNGGFREEGQNWFQGMADWAMYDWAESLGTGIAVAILRRMGYADAEIQKRITEQSKLLYGRAPRYDFSKPPEAQKKPFEEVRNPQSPIPYGALPGSLTPADAIKRQEALDKADEDIGKTYEARLRAWQTYVSELTKDFNKEMARLAEDALKTGDIKGYAEKVNAAYAAYAANWINANKNIVFNENLLAKRRKEIDAERQQREQEQALRLKQFNDQLGEVNKDAQKIVEQISENNFDKKLEGLNALVGLRKDELELKIEALKQANEGISGAPVISDETLRNQVIEEIDKIYNPLIRAYQDLAATLTDVEQKKKALAIAAGLDNERKKGNLDANRLGKNDKKDEKDEKERKAEAAELLAIEQDISEVIADRAAGATQAELDMLEKALETATDRKAVLEQIEAVSIRAAEQDRDRRLKQLEAERDAAKERVEGKANEEEQKKKIEELYQQRKLMAEEEFQRRLKAIRDGINVQIAEEDKTTFQIWKDSWHNFLEKLRAEVGSASAAIGGVADALQRTLGKIVDGIGQAVEQWVLYGETGPAAMKKVLASALASLAAEMAIKAVYALGLGFLNLAVGNFQGAADAFTAAAIFGGTAVAAGLAGRAIAGDSFKKETASNAGTTSSSGSKRSATGGAYSSMSDGAIDISRGTSITPARPEIVIQDRSGMFAKLFEVEVRNNSSVRRLIIETANG